MEVLTVSLACGCIKFLEFYAYIYTYIHVIHDTKWLLMEIISKTIAYSYVELKWNLFFNISSFGFHYMSRSVINLITRGTNISGETLSQ